MVREELPTLTRDCLGPADQHYAHDLDAMLARSGSGPTLVYVCNPNNPTGTLTRQQDLEAFVRRLPATTRVLIDEAYHHYVSPSAGYVSWLDRWLADPHVIVTRSFSRFTGWRACGSGTRSRCPKRPVCFDSTSSRTV